MREVLKRKLEVLFNKDDVSVIEEFLDREGGFCFAGQMAMVEMFLELQEYGTVAAMLANCERTWEGSWAWQNPEERGNPGIDGPVGIWSTAAIERFYLGYGVPCLLSGFPCEISDTPFVVKTANSTYHAGAMELDGGRAIAKEGEKLNFDRGVIYDVLAKGKSMQVKCLDGPSVWYFTTPVYHVDDE